MNFNDIKYKANYYAILLLAFVIPLERKLAPPLIILFLIASLINGSFHLKKKTILYFSLFFILYLVGLIYTENFNYGLSDIETKLSLILFPIAFFISEIDFKSKLNNILTSFVDGCFIASMLVVIHSFIQYYLTLDSSYFFYEKMALFTHPSYASMFLCFGIMITYTRLLSERITLSLKTTKDLLLIIFFSIITILLSSKTGLISIITIHTAALIYWVIKSKLYTKGVIALVLLIFILAFAYTQSTELKSRINEVYSSLTHRDKAVTSTTGTRLNIWGVSINIIKEKPIIGYGTGDVKNILIEGYKSAGLDSLAEQKLNAHNQFLQTTIAIGMIGGIILLLMLFIPLILAFREKHYLYASFILLLLLNFMTESILERQAGVVFYALFNTLFFSAYFSHQKRLVNKE